MQLHLHSTAQQTCNARKYLPVSLPRSCSLRCASSLLANPPALTPRL